MIDSIFTKTRNKREHDIVFKPRDGGEMETASMHKAPIYKYSDLCELAKKYGSATMLSKMFKRSNDNIILLQDPHNMNSGHWFSVSRNPQKKEIYFYISSILSNVIFPSKFSFKSRIIIVYTLS